MEDSNISKIFDFLKVVNELKKSIRYSTFDIEGDSSADHSWRLSLMTFIFAEELKLDIDILRAVKIALVHDLPEAITGDIDYGKIHRGEIKPEDKKRSEDIAMDKICSTLPLHISKEIYGLWTEYEEAKTKEALYVKALDKIETITYCVEKTRKFSEYDMLGTYTDKHVKKFPELVPVLAELKKRLKIEFEKNNIPWKKEYEDYSNIQKKEELIDEIDWNGNAIAVHKKSRLKETMFPHKVCVIIPKGNNGKVVLCRRSKEQRPFPDTWCCAVGGKAIHGESEKDCAEREMKEEIGQILDIEEVSKIIYNEDDYSAIFYIFTTKVPVNHENFCLDPKEIQYTKEFSVEEIIEMIKNNPEEFAPTFREIMKEFAKVYKK